MIAVSIVAVWLVVGLGVGVLFGHAVRKARGNEDLVVPDQPTVGIPYPGKSRHSGRTGKHAAKHHAAA